MKRTTALFLILAFLLLSCPFALAETSESKALELPASNITMLPKFKVDVAALVMMSDGGARPTDLKYKLKNTKYATVNKKGVVTGKKAGSVTLTVSSKSLGQSANCTITIIPNVYNNPSSLDQMIQDMANQQSDGNPLNYHGVFAADRKMYFKNGKLTVDLHFYNHYGYAVTKITKLNLTLFDKITGAKLSSYKKSTVRTKKLADGASFKLTFSFPKKGLDKKYDLTKIDSNGDLEQLDYDGGFTFFHNAPIDDPWGLWDDDDDDDYDYDDMSIKFNALKRTRSAIDGKAMR